MFVALEYCYRWVRLQHFTYISVLTAGLKREARYVADSYSQPMKAILASFELSSAPKSGTGGPVQISRLPSTCYIAPTLQFLDTVEAAIALELAVPPFSARQGHAEPAACPS